MRRTMAKGEAAVWSVLKGHQTSYKFRRQHVIGRFIVDFACIELRLAIEVDGAPYHEGAEQVGYDTYRERALAAAGWAVVRVSDTSVRYHAGWFISFIEGVTDHVRTGAPLPPGMTTNSFRRSDLLALGGYGFFYELDCFFDLLLVEA